MTGPIIVKIGGTTLEDQASAPALWRALADTHRESTGGAVVVHGGGIAVDRHLDRLGFTTERREGIRITPPDQLDQIVAVLAGSINKSLVGRLCAAGAQAVGLCLGDGGAVACARATRYGFDVGRVGEITGTDRLDSASLLPTLLRARFLPVLCSIGLDAAGEFLNVNADDAAAGLVPLLGASSLMLMTDVPGILDRERRTIAETTPAGIESLIASGVISGGMIPKTRAAAAVVAAHAIPVVILSGNDPAALGAFRSGRAVGTRILPS